jgi:hypothetical protein
MRPWLVAAATGCCITAACAPAIADDPACINAAEQSLALRQKEQLHDALRTLAICADPSCPAEVRSECTQRIEAIGVAMPTMIFEAKDGAGNDLSQVTVTMDGAPVLTLLDGRPMSVDPGEHDFRFETAGQPPVEKKVVVREGEKNRHESVVLGPAAPPVSPTPAATSTTSTWNSRKTLAVTSGAVGLVGVGLGIAWGAYALAAQKDEKNACGAGTCAHFAQGTADYDAAKKDATASTVGISVGGALVVTAGVLWLTAPPSAAPVTGTRTTGAPTTDAPKPAIQSALLRLRIAPTVLRAGGGLVIGGDL